MLFDAETQRFRLKQAHGDEREALDTEQNALKIAANSTAYGVYVEINVAKRGNPAQVTVASSTNEPFTFETDKVEEPGPYFHPLLAALITGAARLMLAITERLVIDHGLDWAFCDTDSMAIAKPEAMADEEFADKVDGVVRWFEALNPYEFGGSILKVEDVNFALDTGKPEPLYCWAVSAKRYALFNIAADGQSIMRKVSAHGLGHRLSPYEADDAPKQFPVPDRSVLTDGIKRWHVDLWHAIVKAALADKPDMVSLSYHSAMKSPAISRYGATSPELLRWFKTYNAGKPYRDQVKPFGFLLTLAPKQFVSKERAVLATTRRRKGKAATIKPVTTFDKNLAKAVAKAFDRGTAEPVPATALKTYSEDLAQYHLHPESKFLNGDYFDRGTTLRRHVRMIATRHIGKESNDWERQAILGFDPETAIDYSLGREGSAIFQELFQAHVNAVGVGPAAKALGITRKKAEKLVRGNGDKWADADFSRFAAKLQDAIGKRADEQNLKAGELQELRDRVERDGLRKIARQMGVDPSNLRRRITR